MAVSAKEGLRGSCYPPSSRMRAEFPFCLWKPISSQLLQLGSLRDLSKQRQEPVPVGSWGQGQSLSCCSLPCSASITLESMSPFWGISSRDLPLPPRPRLPALRSQSPAVHRLFIIFGRSQVASNFGQSLRRTNETLPTSTKSSPGSLWSSRPPTNSSS